MSCCLCLIFVRLHNCNITQQNLQTVLEEDEEDIEEMVTLKKKARFKLTKNLIGINNIWKKKNIILLSCYGQIQPNLLHFSYLMILDKSLSPPKMLKLYCKLSEIRQENLKVMIFKMYLVGTKY